MDNRDSKVLILIILIAGIAGGLWYFRNDIHPLTDEAATQPPQSVVAPSEGVVEQTPAASGPIYPLESSGSPEPTEGETVSLPPLDDSDSEFLQAMIAIFGSDIGQVLANTGLIDKFVATVDNLPGSHLSEKIRPLRRVPGRFQVDATSDGEQFILSPDNYRRYDSLVNLAARANPDTVIAMYRRYYPLFQESYSRLGYPDRYFNDRAVEVIDNLLATPEPEGPVLLIRPHVMYQFADPALEELSSGQKILIRMGGEHARTIKQVLRNLRTLLIQSPGQAP